MRLSVKLVNKALNELNEDSEMKSVIIYGKLTEKVETFLRENGYWYQFFGDVLNISKDIVYLLNVRELYEINYQIMPFRNPEKHISVIVRVLYGEKIKVFA